MTTTTILGRCKRTDVMHSGKNKLLKRFLYLKKRKSMIPVTFLQDCCL